MPSAQKDRVPRGIAQKQPAVMLDDRDPRGVDPFRDALPRARVGEPHDDVPEADRALGAAAAHRRRPRY